MPVDGLGAAAQLSSNLDAREALADETQHFDLTRGQRGQRGCWCSLLAHGGWGARPTASTPDDGFSRSASRPHLRPHDKRPGGAASHLADARDDIVELVTLRE